MSFRARLASALFGLLLLVSPAAAQPVQSFADFVAGFQSKALAAGITEATYRAATAGITPDPSIPKLIVGQPEFTTSVWEYMDRRITADRIARGQNAMGRNQALFDAVGAKYGVDPYILAAIWGIETDYGAVLGNKTLIKPVIRSLFTLVHQRRGRLAEDEADLIAALKLVQFNDDPPQSLVGSWAGAIGHLQVNPSNVVAHGVDGDGDGKIELNTSLADALATSASFLRSLGYQPGHDWGYEVELPDGFDYTLAGRTQYRDIGFFADRGVARVKGRRWTERSTPVFLYVPAGRRGPKFLMTPNYLALKGYNFSDSYAITVAHLADRLKGSGGFVQAWPRDTKFPNLVQRKAIQQALIKLGLYSGTVDGRLGPVSQEAYARFQAARGEIADGFITLDSYRALVGATQ